MDVSIGNGKVIIKYPNIFHEVKSNNNDQCQTSLKVKQNHLALDITSCVQGSFIVVELSFYKFFDAF